MDCKTQITEQCAKLSGKKIVCIIHIYMKWGPLTLLLNIAKVQNGKTLVKT